MPRKNKAPVRYSTHEVLVAYLEGKVIEFSFVKNADDSAPWGTVPAYGSPSDVIRISNSNYSFRIKQVAGTNCEEYNVDSNDFKKGDEVIIVGNSYSHDFPLNSRASYVSPYTALGDHFVRIGDTSQILHRDDFIKV